MHAFVGNQNKSLKLYCLWYTILLLPCNKKMPENRGGYGGVADERKTSARFDSLARECLSSVRWIFRSYTS